MNGRSVLFYYDTPKLETVDGRLVFAPRLTAAVPAQNRGVFNSNQSRLLLPVVIFYPPDEKVESWPSKLLL